MKSARRAWKKFERPQGMHRLSCKCILSRFGWSSKDGLGSSAAAHLEVVAMTRCFLAFPVTLLRFLETFASHRQVQQELSSLQSGRAEEIQEA